MIQGVEVFLLGTRHNEALCSLFNTMVAEVLTMQGARAPGAMYWPSYPWNIPVSAVEGLTHWGLTIIGSNNGLSPGRRQAITWTNAGILLTGP